MAYSTDISTEQSRKPSKLLSLIALVVAFCLPFVLVKMFPYQHEVRHKAAYLSPYIKHLVYAKSFIPSIKNYFNRPKLDVKNTVISNSGWNTVYIKPRDSLSGVFNRLKIPAGTLQIILQNKIHKKWLSHLKVNQKLEFLIKNNVLEKMVLPVSTVKTLTIYREKSIYKSIVTSRPTTVVNHYTTAVIQQSLYATIKHAQLPHKILNQIINIFSAQTDFHKARKGDQFTVIYQAYYIDNKLVDIGNITAVSYHHHNQWYQAFRHQLRNGQIEYLNHEGISFKKAYSRYPLRFSHISSTFSLSRMHPLLHYRRPHKGIDLAAPIGTPILATGDGKIEIIDRQSGYGNMIKIKHNAKYSSIYGHMLRFQKGLSKGTLVKRGQVIGYVGQSGLASGPHCHYELHVNNQPKNPTTVELPLASPLFGRELAAFKNQSRILLAKIHSFENTQLAKKKVATKQA